MAVNEQDMLDIDHAIRESGDPDKELDFFQKHPVFEKIESKIRRLQKQLIKHQKEDDQPKWRVDKINDIQYEIDFYYDLLKYLSEQFNSMRSFYDSFLGCVKAYREGSELVRLNEILQEVVQNQNEEIQILLDKNIELCQRIKNPETIDPGKLKEYSEKFKDVSRNLLITMRKRTKQIYESKY